MRVLHLQVNGDRIEVAAPEHWTLLEVLRYSLGLTGSKQGCDKGDCGACTVLLDGRPVLACLTLAALAEGREVTTIEGLLPAHVRAGGEGPDPIQEAFDRCGALQCGFCQPGMILSARALLNENPRPTRQEIRAALSGNLCRCTGYTQIVQAVELAVAESLGVAPDPPAWAPDSNPWARDGEGCALGHGPSNGHSNGHAQENGAASGAAKRGGQSATVPRPSPREER